MTRVTAALCIRCNTSGLERVPVGEGRWELYDPNREEPHVCDGSAEAVEQELLPRPAPAVPPRIPSPRPRRPPPGTCPACGRPRRRPRWSWVNFEQEVCRCTVVGQWVLGEKR